MHVKNPHTAIKLVIVLTPLASLAGPYRDRGRDGALRTHPHPHTVESREPGEYGIVLFTFRDQDSEPRDDGSIPPALSGPEDAPSVLDNLKLRVVIAVGLIVLPYAIPLASVAIRGGLFGPDVGPPPVGVDPCILLVAVFDLEGS